MFDDYLRRWNLIPDGDPIETRSSRLLPVAWAGLSAAWHLEDGTPPETALRVAEMAAAGWHLLRVP